MQAEKQQQPWKIYIHAKAKKLHFKLKATSIVPAWGFHRCSILLKLGKYLLRFNFEYGTPIIPRKQQPKTLKSKFLRFLQKVRPKNRVIGSHPEENSMLWFAYKELIFIGYLVVGILAFLYQYQDRKGIIIHGSVISLYLALFFEKYMTGRIRNFLVLSVFATVVCSLVFDLDNYWKYDYLRMAWNYVVSSGLPGISQAFISLYGG